MNDSEIRTTSGRVLFCGTARIVLGVFFGLIPAVAPNFIAYSKGIATVMFLAALLDIINAFQHGRFRGYWTHFVIGLVSFVTGLFALGFGIAFLLQVNEHMPSGFRGDCGDFFIKYILLGVFHFLCGLLRAVSFVITRPPEGSRRFGAAGGEVLVGIVMFVFFLVVTNNRSLQTTLTVVDLFKIFGILSGIGFIFRGISWRRLGDSIREQEKLERLASEGVGYKKIGYKKSGIAGKF